MPPRISCVQIKPKGAVNMTQENNTTEIVFVMDRSGSMGGKESDVVGGYNSFIKKQMLEPGKTIVTTVLFDTRYKVIRNGVQAEDALMRDGEYTAGGCTALLDAVGNAILSVGDRISRTPEYLRPGKVIFVITTDGLENASHEFSRRRIFELVEHQKERYGWSFIFVGADIDAFAEGGEIGIDRSDVFAFDSSKVSNFQAMNAACSMASLKRNTKNKGKKIFDELF